MTLTLASAVRYNFKIKKAITTISGEDMNYKNNTARKAKQKGYFESLIRM